MNLYAAHLIYLVTYDDGVQDNYPIWENVHLVIAVGPEDAFESAKKVAAETEHLDPVSCDERPAHMVFQGVRKIFRIFELDESLETGIELTSTRLEVKSEDDLKKLVSGEEVVVTYDEIGG